MNVNDKVSMEYEARVMVSESQYSKIRDKYLNSGHICHEFTNKNTYFDTSDLYMTNHHIVLRIREIDDIEKELTLKVKLENGDEEITERNISDNDCCRYLAGEIDAKQIVKELTMRGVDVNDLRVVATLVTERLEVSFSNFLLVIDKNYYNNKIDFNIEVESTSRKEAEKYLLEIIEPFAIEYKKDYISKSRRAILKL